MISLGSVRAEAALSGLGGTAAALFGVVAWRVLGNHTWRDDLRIRRLLPRYGPKTKQAALWFGRLGKEWAVLPAAAALAGQLWKDDRRTGAAAIAAAASAAVAASHIFDAAFPKRTPPPGRRAPFEPSFPSGHALNSTAFLLTAAYVLSREKLVESETIGTVAVALSAALGVDRMIHDRHWTSDVVGGWIAAVALAAFAAAGYELAERRGIPGIGGNRPTVDEPRLRSRTSIAPGFNRAGSSPRPMPR